MYASPDSSILLCTSHLRMHDSTLAHPLKIRWVGVIPFKKANRLRISALRHTAAGRCDLVAPRLANFPKNNALDPRFLDGGAASFKARDQDAARDIGVEHGHATTFVRHVALQILLYGSRADARGSRAVTTFRIDYCIVGV